MAVFTIETTYHLPVYRQRTYVADTLEAACRLAAEDEGWSDERSDVDSSGETFVTGIWSGADAAYWGDALAIPSQFGETIQRQVELFQTLIDLLKEPAHPMGLSAGDFARWLPRAQAAIAKAEAILAGDRDPDGSVSG